MTISLSVSQSGLSSRPLRSLVFLTLCTEEPRVETSDCTTETLYVNFTKLYLNLTPKSTSLLVIHPVLTTVSVSTLEGPSYTLHDVLILLPFWRLRGHRLLFRYLVTPLYTSFTLVSPSLLVLTDTNMFGLRCKVLFLYQLSQFTTSLRFSTSQVFHKSGLNC